MSTEIVRAGKSHPDNARRQRPRKPANPLQAGILSYCAENGLQAGNTERLEADDLPKRFTLYPPLLLLPANFAEQSLKWTNVFSNLNEESRGGLFRSIVFAFSNSGKRVTHVAINAPILPKKIEGASSNENRLRSPFNLLPVHGDFGPSLIEGGASTPNQADFDAAFWVSFSQLAGITQVWSPKWTMFSRGNLCEKSRILRNDRRIFPGMTVAELGISIEQSEVADLYVGIGYFAFSFLKSGVKRVWGWDISPWSIEGLRRGCEKNGWRCIVVQSMKTGNPSVLKYAKSSREVSNVCPSGGRQQSRYKNWDPLSDATPNVAQLAKMIAEGDDENNEASTVRCVAFLGDNIWAADILKSVEADLAKIHGVVQNVRHINLGLLPSSRLSWRNAVRALHQLGGWLHVHENVDTKDIGGKADEVVQELDKLVAESRDERWNVSCQHVEQVKTYAPGVMHCVFDVKVSRRGSAARVLNTP